MLKNHDAARRSQPSRLCKKARRRSFINCRIPELGQARKYVDYPDLENRTLSVYACSPTPDQEDRMRCSSGKLVNTAVHDSSTMTQLFGSSINTQLFRAVRTGKVKAVKRLCQGDRVDITTTDRTGRTVLHIGAEQGGTGLFHFLLECSGLNINAADDSGKTALFYAAQFERVVLLQRLLSSYGALVDIRDKSGRTALSYAAQHNSYRSTELLLEAGAEIALEDDHGRSPLFYAVQSGNYAATVRHVRHIKDGNLALLLAGQMGRTKIQSKLMTLEASIANWEIGILQKLLLQSARSGRDDMVRPLVQFHGIEVDTQDADGRTPLSLAAERGHCNVVRILSKRGANRELKDSNGQSPVDYALRHGPVTHRCILRNWMPWSRDPNPAH